MKVECKNCNNLWEYKGTSYFALCSKCRKLTKVNKKEMKKGEQQK